MDDEERLVARWETPTCGEAYTFRRDLDRFRRVVAPLREVLNALVRRDEGDRDESTRSSSGTCTTTSSRCFEELDMDREIIAAALEGHMSVVSNRLNAVVLKVSAWAAIIAVPTVIASVYGMNFRHMPE